MEKILKYKKKQQYLILLLLLCTLSDTAVADELVVSIKHKCTPMENQNIYWV